MIATLHPVIKTGSKIVLLYLYFSFNQYQSMEPLQMSCESLVAKKPYKFELKKREQKFATGVKVYFKISQIAAIKLFNAFTNESLFCS